MIEQKEEEIQSAKTEDETDKVFLTGDGFLQAPEEAQTEKKDDYYEVDEKKLVVTNIGDGTPHEEGLAETADEDDTDQ